MKNNIIAKLGVLASTLATYAGAKRGNVGSVNTINFLDQIEQCWQTLRQNLVIRDTTPLGQGAGVLNWLLSATNINASDSRMMLDGIGRTDGKDYKLRRTWYPKQHAGNLANHDIVYCNVSGGESADLVDEVSIRYRHTGPPVLLDKARIRCKDKSWQQYVSERLSENLRLFEVGFAKKVAALVSAGVKHDGQPYLGAFPGEGIAGMVKEWPVMEDDGKTVNTTGLAWFKEIFENLELNGRMPAIIGGTFFSILAKKLGYETCNSCNGVDAAAVRSDIEGMFLRDTEIGARIGNKDAVLAIMPGALRLVTRVRNVGDFVESDDNHRRFTIVSPRTGRTVDVYWNRQCGEDYKYSFQYSIEWDVIGYPACWTQDPCLKGVTDVLAFKPVCRTTPLCDLEVPGCNVLPAPVEGINRSCDDGLLQTCLNPCSAAFTSTQATKCFHDVAGAVGFNVIDINGLEYALTQTYDDLTDAGQVAALTADLVRLLPQTSRVMVVSDTQILLDVPCAVTSIDLKLDSATLFTFTRTQLGVICYSGHAVATTGGIVTNITWTMPDATVIAGAPGTPIAIPGYYGTVDAFCVDIELAGDPQSDVTITVQDSKACEKSYTGLNFDCLEGDAPAPPVVGAGVCDYASVSGINVEAASVEVISIGGVEYPIGIAPDDDLGIIAAIEAAIGLAGGTFTAVSYGGPGTNVIVTGSDVIIDYITVDGVQDPFVQSNCA